VQFYNRADKFQVYVVSGYMHIPNTESIFFLAVYYRNPDIVF